MEGQEAGYLMVRVRARPLVAGRRTAPRPMELKSTSSARTHPDGTSTSGATQSSTTTTSTLSY
jgi:hypothetical protein